VAPSEYPDAERIVATASRAAVATDPGNRITHWNAVATELLGRVGSEVIGRNFQEIVQARDVFGNALCASHCAFHSIVRAGSAPENFDLDVMTAEGQKVRVAVSIVVVLGPLSDEYSLVYLLAPKRRRRRADEAIDRLLAERGPAGPAATGADQRGRRRQPRLTTRQKEVLALMVLGRNSSEMAEELGVSVHTVRSHVQGVLKALEVSTRVEAVSRALSERML
jgi:DNA-binding CsgD family transcriptional regulator